MKPIDQVSDTMTWCLNHDECIATWAGLPEACVCEVLSHG